MTVSCIGREDSAKSSNTGYHRRRGRSFVNVFVQKSVKQQSARKLIEFVIQQQLVLTVAPL